MIGTLLRIHWLNLSRDRVAQSLTFVLPVVFFSIFAGIFGSQGRAVTPRIRVAVVDEDRSELSGRLVHALEAEPELRVRTDGAAPAPGASPAPLDRAQAESLVRSGDVPVAIVLPAGLGASFGDMTGTGPRVQVLADVSDPIAPQLVQGLLQKVVMTGVPDAFIQRGMDQFERYAGPLTPAQRQSLDDWLPRLRARPSPPAGNRSGGEGAALGLLPVETVNVMRERTGNSLVAFYAAGTAVMFLLFSCTAGAGTLLEEVESGTLERLLTSRVGMNGLLAGKWAFLSLIGMVQITVMFVWGAIAFKLDLASHLPGFVVMTVTTAGAAAGFALLLATACRTRQQVSGLGTIVIMIMSAFGGSMFPRFLMSDALQKVGLFTFNAWALDGYVKVFWRNAAVRELWPQVLVLVAAGAVFLTIARLLARRWEAA